MKNSIYLTTLVNRLKNSPNWAKGDLDAIVISKKPNVQIVITALHNGTEIKSFQSGNSVTFHIIEGKLAFHSQKESVILNEGQLFTLYEKVKYKLESMEDTVFMLTITNNTVNRKMATRIWTRDNGVTVQ
jgi:quercetin dioxygenase-like cupin family protein